MDYYSQTRISLDITILLAMSLLIALNVIILLLFLQIRPNVSRHSRQLRSLLEDVSALELRDPSQAVTSNIQERVKVALSNIDIYAKHIQKKLKAPSPSFRPPNVQNCQTMQELEVTVDRLWEQMKEILSGKIALPVQVQTSVQCKRLEDRIINLTKDYGLLSNRYWTLKNTSNLDSLTQRIVTNEANIAKLVDQVKLLPSSAAPLEEAAATARETALAAVNQGTADQLSGIRGAMAQADETFRQHEVRVHNIEGRVQAIVNAISGAIAVSQPAAPMPQPEPIMHASVPTAAPEPAPELAPEPAAAQTDVQQELVQLPPEAPPITSAPPAAYPAQTQPPTSSWTMTFAMPGPRGGFMPSRTPSNLPSAPAETSEWHEDDGPDRLEDDRNPKRRPGSRIRY